MTSEPRDRNGHLIREHDLVRVVGLPDLEGFRSQTHRVFRRLVGTYRRVTGFDERGNAELLFRIRTGRDRGTHIVGIEPYLLHLPRTKQPKSKRLSNKRLQRTNARGTTKGGAPRRRGGRGVRR